MPTTTSRLAAVFAATFACALTAHAQAQLQAAYPLMTDLADANGSYAPMVLFGNPTPPAAPANGVCVNGTSPSYPGGQLVRTPNIGSLNTNDFEVAVEFELAALPAIAAPVLMGGYLYRWIGIYVDATGTVGVKSNNGSIAWSSTTVAPGSWHSGVLKYEAGTAELYVDGNMVLQAAIGLLIDGGDLDFSTADGGNGRSHRGCIRNLLISNDTTLGTLAAATSYGAGCDAMTMAANGVPSIGNSAFALAVSNVPAVSPAVFIGFGGAAFNPGVDLTTIGMAGCFAYTSLDLGLYGPFAAVGGTTNIALPIPNTPAIAGIGLSAQGVAFSATTILGMAASNGTLLTIAP